MKLFKKVIAVIATLSMIIGTSVISFANEFSYDENTVFKLQETPPPQDLLRDSSPPSSSSSKNAFDLRRGTYNYNCESISVTLYTNHWFTGESSIQVAVDNLRNIRFAGGTHGLKIAVYGENNKKISEKTVTMSNDPSYGVVSFSGLDSTKPYYLKFMVNNTGDRWAFDGTVN